MGFSKIGCKIALFCDMAKSKKYVLQHVLLISLEFLNFEAK